MLDAMNEKWYTLNIEARGGEKVEKDVAKRNGTCASNLTPYIPTDGWHYVLLVHRYRAGALRTVLIGLSSCCETLTYGSTDTAILATKVLVLRTIANGTVLVASIISQPCGSSMIEITQQT